MSCNVICLPQYQCGDLQKVKPNSGAVYAPFVTVTLGGMITVGNNSFPGEPNTACIKSFEYGGSTGEGCTVEIIDESGNSFARYFEKINKDLCQATADYGMEVDFGWISRSADGTITKLGIPNGPIYFLPKGIESTYEGGVIKYTIKGEDLMSHLGESRVQVPVGTESNKVRLMPAVRRMFSRNCPPINNIRYLRRSGENLTEWRFKNSDGGPEGPMGVWPGDQQSPVSAARKWFNSLTTDRGKGFYTVWNAGKPEPELWLFEDPRPYCDETTADGRNCVGTYIVNGGDCSPVISFSPKAEWVFSAELGSGGNLGGATSARTIKMRPLPGRPCNADPNKPGAGTTTQFASPQNDINWRPPDQVTAKMQQAMAVHELAAQYPELSAPMEGELKIHGDPRFVHSAQWRGSVVSIIVINPFHIFAGGSYNEWIAGPMCNPIYSDKAWDIEGVNHQISEGSYTTTLKVKCHNLTKTDQ